MNINDITPRRLNELSADTLASYKKKAGAAATAADAAGDVKTGNQRFSGIVKATKKQFDQDAKGKKTNEAAAVPAAAALPAQGVKQPWLPTNKAKAAPVAAAKPLPTTPPAPVAAPVAAAKPLPTTPAAPPAAPVAAATPAVDPVQQKADQMQQSLLDRMGKRFGLPPGSSQEQVQAAQQEYLNKNDPAAAAQYQQNMANIEAGGSQADNKPVQLAPTAAPAKPQQSADWTAGLAAQQAGGSPIAIMLAQPSIAGNQAMLDNIAKPLGLPPGSTAAEISAADAKQPSVKQQGIDSLAADQGYAAGTSVEQMAIDNIAKMAGLPTGMTQDEMMAAYAKKTQAARSTVSAAPVAEHYVLDELDHGKLIESQLDNTLDDLYETLNEFAPGMAEAGPRAVDDQGNPIEKSKNYSVSAPITTDQLKPGSSYSTNKGVVTKTDTGLIHKARSSFTPTPQGVSEDSLASMKRLAGIAAAQTQTTPGQRQYRHMPTAVQPR